MENSARRTKPHNDRLFVFSQGLGYEYSGSSLLDTGFKYGKGWTLYSEAVLRRTSRKFGEKPGSMPDDL
jgi:hypothetical protein